MNNYMLLTAIQASSNGTMTQPSSSWTYTNTLTTISIFITVFGAIVALYQWYVSNKIKQAEFLHQLTVELRSDDIIREAFYAIEYDYHWYDDNFHNGKNGWESKIDKLLALLDYICYLKAQKIISEKEFSVLQYTVERVCSSPEAQSYLWNLYHFSQSQGSLLSFKNLVDYAIEKNLFPDKFTSIDCKSYKKRLIF